MIKQFGLLKHDQLEPARNAMSHPGIAYALVMDRQAMWDPSTIEQILADFPKGYLEESDLFLILAECVANAVLHGQADALGFHARERHGLLLLSFFQIPPMLDRIVMVLAAARQGKTRDLIQEIPGGLGFPILMRLVHRITVTEDRTRLQLWLRLQKG